MHIPGRTFPVAQFYKAEIEAALWDGEAEYLATSTNMGTGTNENPSDDDDFDGFTRGAGASAGARMGGRRLPSNDHLDYELVAALLQVGLVSISNTCTWSFLLPHTPLNWSQLDSSQPLTYKI
jgi:hypothetical protein